MRVEIILGTGVIGGGTHLTVNRVRFELDCTDARRSLPGCREPHLLRREHQHFLRGGYLGLPIAPVDRFPNEVVFSASPGVVIPARQDPSTAASNSTSRSRRSRPAARRSSKRAASRSPPETPHAIRQATLLPPPLRSVSEIRICNCDDGNACTVEHRDPEIACVHTPVNPPAATTTPARPTPATRPTGCVFAPNAPCNDNNACTTDTCDPAIGCVYSQNPPCDDNNVCTDDTCDPAIGCVFSPNVPWFDNNACTTDWCDPQSGRQHSAVCTIVGLIHYNMALPTGPNPTDPLLDQPDLSKPIAGVSILRTSNLSPPATGIGDVAGQYQFLNEPGRECNPDPPATLGQRTGMPSGHHRSRCHQDLQVEQCDDSRCPVANGWHGHHGQWHREFL